MAQPLFVQPPYLYVVFAAGLVLFVREVIVQRRPVPGTDHDRGSFRVLWSVTGLTTTAAVLVPFVPIAPIGATRIAFWIGIACLLVGAGIRLWAVRTLEAFFTNQIAIHPEHEIVDAGLYAVVRHPAYTGACLTYVGIGLAFGSWVSLALTAAGAGIGYGYRITVEESVLRAELGETSSVDFEPLGEGTVAVTWDGAYVL